MTLVTAAFVPLQPDQCHSCYNCHQQSSCHSAEYEAEEGTLFCTFGGWVVVGGCREWIQVEGMCGEKVENG